MLRGMQLVARLGLEADPDTVRLSSGIGWRELSVERVFEEWRKLLVLGVEIGGGLSFLQATGWIEAYPELQATVGCEQDPEWHPEGDVWTHTGHVLDAFRGRAPGRWRGGIWSVGLACLCHDLGKPATTRFVDGRLRSRGPRGGRRDAHEEFSGAAHEPPRPGRRPWVRLVVDHLKPRQLYQGGAGGRRRCAGWPTGSSGSTGWCGLPARMPGGRPPLPPADCEDCDWLLARAEALRIRDQAPAPSRPRPRPDRPRSDPRGPEIGDLVDRCYQAQLDGAFEGRTAGLRFLDSLLRRRGASGRAEP